jgi:chromosome segregation protein
MMQTRINRILLQGFKSFNRKISIPFVPGITIITGPNGSGKSNVLDAICFALGTISTKSLRASRLPELIFHGSEKKKAARQASVTIYLDNSKKVFPFEEREVSISRRINQKGVCVYKLNGKTVTREKILQVLSAARIHPDGHNIIFQGDINEIIEMNPVERRYVIDEISGIAEYNERKRKALRDLEFVEQKLKEAEILISERYNIFRKLEQERNAALRYRELTTRLKVLKASFVNKRYELLKERFQKISKRIENKRETLRKVSTRLEKIEKDLDEKSEELRDIATKLIRFSKRMEIDKKITQLRTEILLKQNELSAAQREIERLNSVIERLQVFEARRAEIRGEMPRAVREILTQKFRGVYGTVGSLIKVPPELEKAIRVAAGGHWHDIVVENENVAIFCINFLKEEKIGRATFLPLNKLRPTIFSDYSLLNRDGVIGIASKLIKYDTKYMRAVEFVFGNTLIVRDFEAAKNVGIGKVRMVTLDGDLIERSGAMSGGYFVSPLRVRAAEEREIEFYLKQRKQLRESVKKIKNEIEKLEEKLRKLSEKEVTRELVDLKKLRIASQRELDELKEKRKKLYERKISIQRKLSELEIEGARLESELKTLEIELREYGEMKLLDERLEEIGRLIRKVEKEIEDLGPVNFKAIEEYEIFKKEFDKYKEKYEKILEEKEAILKMIDKIEERKKEVFFSCLEKISNYFNAIFNKITGGTAELELEDPDNLESGLIIKASPKGKSLLYIDAMSGGEKTLTALAFLFAIQKFKPAPFYVLDEIDATLDKENTIKICEMLRELSKNSQFIIITHNDQTLRYGDVIYGVSMVDGESKIVGLELPG